MIRSPNILFNRFLQFMFFDVNNVDMGHLSPTWIAKERFWYTNFLSISFDTEFDTPVMLKAYADTYQADPAHWSFLTGPADKIAELARQSGVSYQYEDGTFNHDFRTLIVDASGHLQMVFPTSGDLSDPIVDQIIKAAGVTNQLALKK